MPIYDHDGTTSFEIGTLYDHDGSANHQIGTVYDNDGTTNTLIYSAETEYFNNGFSTFGYSTYNLYGGATISVGTTITITLNAGLAQGILYIYADLTNINSISFTFNNAVLAYNGICCAGVSSTKSAGVPNAFNPSEFLTYQPVTGVGTVAVNTSSITGYNYIVISASCSTGGGSSWTCSKITGS